MSGSFSATVEGFCDNAALEIEMYCRGVALTLFGMILEATPVLHGRLRGDWRTSIASPNYDIRPVSEGASPESLEDIARKEMEATIAEWSGKQPLYFANNLPYAVPVEYEGHSSVKAPQGMVRVSVLTVQSNLAKELP